MNAMEHPCQSYENFQFLAYKFTYPAWCQQPNQRVCVCVCVCVCGIFIYEPWLGYVIEKACHKPFHMPK